MELKTILVAEDTDSSFALVSVLLRREYNVKRAMNGQEAVQLHSELRPDLILMDIQMPVLNGLEATRTIRLVDKEVPIIALTAFAFESDKEAFMNAGGTSYITKPIDTETLRSVIRDSIQD